MREANADTGPIEPSIKAGLETTALVELKQQSKAKQHSASSSISSRISSIPHSSTGAMHSTVPSSVSVLQEQRSSAPGQEPVTSNGKDEYKRISTTSQPGTAGQPEPNSLVEYQSANARLQTTHSGGFDKGKAAALDVEFRHPRDLHHRIPNFRKAAQDSTSHHSLVTSPTNMLPNDVSPRSANAPSPTRGVSSQDNIRTSGHGPNRQRSDREVLVGTPVKEGHVNYMLMYDMLTGIRVSVSRCNAKPMRELVPEDYYAAHKLAFDV